MWQEKENHLYRALKFKNFPEAFAFMTQVALIAERLNHHPTWKNNWDTVEIWLMTHEGGDRITEKDRELALEIDNIIKIAG
jgi:4a-hydroxytetrahydrobiopterin dehydratase